MRIAIATAVYYPQINGVAVFSHNLAVGLAKRGHEVMVITPSQTGKNSRQKIDGVDTAYLKSVNSRVYPDQISAVPKKKKFLGREVPHLFYKKGLRVAVFPAGEVQVALDDFKPEVVHVQVSDPIGLSVVRWARKRKVPVVTTEHNQPEVFTGPLHVPKMVKRGADAVLSAYFRNRQSKSDFVTMPTEQAIKNLLEKHPIDVPVMAVSNGVDLSNFKPGAVQTGIYKQYGLKEDAPTVLYVGRVDPEKQVEVVIKAVKKMRDKAIWQMHSEGLAKKRNTEAKNKIEETGLVIVGDGVDKARLEQLYGQEPWIHFLGRVLPPDLYELYKVGWVFATASEIETQGIVLIEAAATGLPLIAVNGGAVAEVCRHGENGFLCEPKNADEMAEAMQKILTDDKLRQKFAQKSLEIAQEHDFERTLDKFEEIYNELIN